MIFLLFGITILILLLDQLTKYFAFEAGQPVVLINKVVEIVQTENDGIAFGIGGGFEYGYILWSILALLTVSFLFFFYVKYTARRLIDTLALAMIAGGALGNLVDRLITGGKVRDFIQLSFIRWPAFNLADAAIVVGVILMVFAIAFDHAELAPNAKSDGPVDLTPPDTP